MCGTNGRLTFTVLVINLVLRTATSSDMFSSVAELEYLYNKEKIVGRLLEDLSRQSEDIIQNDSVHQYVNAIQVSSFIRSYSEFVSQVFDRVERDTNGWIGFQRSDW